MKIVVDAMGGDFAPKVNVDGAIDALRDGRDSDEARAANIRIWKSFSSARKR